MKRYVTYIFTTYFYIPFSIIIGLNLDRSDKGLITFKIQLTLNWYKELGNVWHYLPHASLTCSCINKVLIKTNKLVKINAIHSLEEYFKGCTALSLLTGIYCLEPYFSAFKFQKLHQNATHRYLGQQLRGPHCQKIANRFRLLWEKFKL